MIPVIYFKIIKKILFFTEHYENLFNNKHYFEKYSQYISHRYYKQKIRH